MVNKLYAAAAGTVSLDMRDAGNITGLLVSTDSAAIGQWEVSFNSSSSFTTNDTTGVIATGFIIADTAPVSFAAMKEPVEVGERLFLHVTGANKVSVAIYTDSESKRPAVRRR